LREKQASASAAIASHCCCKFVAAQVPDRELPALRGRRPRDGPGAVPVRRRRLSETGTIIEAHAYLSDEEMLGQMGLLPE
jgi:hypothetical protein